MKIALILLTAIIGIQAHAIDFKGPTSNPLSLTLTRVDSVDERYESACEKNRPACLRVDVSGPSYNIYTATGGNLPHVSLSHDEAVKLLNDMNAVSPACPLKIDFDRTTGVILKATIGCDPLALREVQPNEG